MGKGPQSFLEESLLGYDFSLSSLSLEMVLLGAKRKKLATSSLDMRLRILNNIVVPFLVLLIPRDDGTICRSLSAP